MISKYMRMIKTAWKHMRRSPYQAMAVVFIMSLTFFVATGLAALAYSMSQVIKYFETRPQIIAFLKDQATPEEISALQFELQDDLRIKNVNYVSRIQALEIYKEATKTNPLLSEFVPSDVFPASLEFSVADLSFVEEVVHEVESESIVDQVRFTASLGDSASLGQVVENLRKVAMYIKIGGLAVLGYLVGSSLLTLLVVISMRISSRREEIQILSLIGATTGFIRGPFLIEGMFYAILGAFLGWFVSVLIVLYAAPHVVSYFGEIQVIPSEITRLLGLLGILLGAEVLLAMVLGLLGSFVALSRHLKT